MRNVLLAIAVLIHAAGCAAAFSYPSPEMWKLRTIGVLIPISGILSAIGAYRTHKSQWWMLCWISILLWIFLGSRPAATIMSALYAEFSGTWGSLEAGARLFMTVYVLAVAWVVVSIRYLKRDRG